MNFWQKMKKLIPLRHVIFILILFAVTLVIFYFDSAEDIKVTFGDEALDVKSKSYYLNIPYDMVEQVELAPIVDGGTKVTGGDNMVTRTGVWQNDTWGEYHICADLDCANGIVVYLTDGQIFVFSRKNDTETAAIYEQLLSHLPQPVTPAA